MPRSISPQHCAPTKTAPFHLLSTDRHERYLTEVLPREAQKEREAAAARAAADKQRQVRARCCCHGGCAYDIQLPDLQLCGYRVCACKTVSCFT